MEKEMGMAAIFVICAVVLLMGMLKSKAGAVFRFAARMAAGAAAICLTNHLLPAGMGAIAVGVNPYSLLTVGALGLGGYGLLYGIMLYDLLQGSL